jgi:hypothetical protein
MAAPGLATQLGRADNSCKKEMCMRILAWAALLGTMLAGAERDPVELRVTSHDQMLSYEVVNTTPYRIVNWQVITRFTSGGYEQLGCGVNVQVKQPSDLKLRDVFSLPRDAVTGKPVTFESRIVEVKFANGLKWKPEETPE